jgi:hypothetical protein
MRYIRLALLAACAATLVTGSAFAQGQALSTPQGLKPFLLRANEPAVHEFSRTPSFSWSPVRGAVRYEFQLAKNISFDESSIFWVTGSVRGPATAIPLSLPWMTGTPYAAYARVRGVTSGGNVSPWSLPYGFNLRWKDVPKQLPEYPGLSRWSPVDGATGYEVWFTNIGPGFEKHVTMRTNSVDHREAYTFHDSPAWTSTVKWRVRAIRNGEGIVHLNGLPAVYYGPWSTEYVSTNAPQSGALQVLAAVTNGATSTVGSARDHELTPALAFTGREALNTFGGSTFGLYRVYVATDSDCVNVIFKGAIVGSPAYSPRTSGPLDLPTDTTDALPKALNGVLKDGTEANTFMAGVVPVITTEQAPADTEAGAPSSTPPASGPAPATDGTTSSGATAPKAVDLPESGWPSGRFYWTVVPVKMVLVDEGKKIEYHETEPAQDACQAGNVISFGKDSSPVVAGQGTAYASGMSTGGRLVAAVGPKSVFYGQPLVAWQPVQGAAGYEIQWSHNRDRWRTLGSLETEGTAATLPLKPGQWWYRVRARNPYLPGHVKRMAWSTPLAVTVASPKFRLVASSK